mmetsp:Transcript_7322/g.10471  ORF Transcript_7322/g.10471 Transcript_7322/m.10471 type:complete len:126 (-) Transcript_7322:373-750(-)|eukprot:CAMPEP_0184856248 /NCGR_PEP_ID=MMETSP0580-20130426/1424_1 /TAXON_ID=1118495 /ORGANISM="Dactyliosolen fragilissimus" /LENGTH=125 /DNA_ID=CAMNT_0027351159 /DNA_START=147 /DNA_END=524 /DNA_ORIENTATION=+
MLSTLSKSQKDEFATSFAVLALYDGGAEVTSEQINTLLAATGNEVEAFYPIIYANFLSDSAKISELITSPGGSGGGSGGGAGAAGGDGDAAEEVEKEEEKVEEEEIDMAGGMDMFGGDEEGGGDY